MKYPYPENKDQVTDLLRENFPMIEQAKNRRAPMSDRESIIIGNIGQLIVLYGLNIESLETQELFAALLSVNGNTKHWGALRYKALRRKNELQVSASKRIGVTIERGRSKFPNSLEINFEIWSTHMPIRLAKRLGVPIPPEGRRFRIVRKKKTE